MDPDPGGKMKADPGGSGSETQGHLLIHGCLIELCYHSFQLADCSLENNIIC